MAGGFVLVHGEAGRQPDVLQIMARKTQLNRRKFSKIHKTFVNTYSEMGRRQEGADPSKICDGSKEEIPGDPKVDTLNALHCLTLEPFWQFFNTKRYICRGRWCKRGTDS